MVQAFRKLHVKENQLDAECMKHYRIKISFNDTKEINKEMQKKARGKTNAIAKIEHISN